LELVEGLHEGSGRWMVLPICVYGVVVVVEERIR